MEIFPWTIHCLNKKQLLKSSFLTVLRANFLMMIIQGRCVWLETKPAAWKDHCQSKARAANQLRARILSNSLSSSCMPMQKRFLMYSARYARARNQQRVSLWASERVSEREIEDLIESVHNLSLSQHATRKQTRGRADDVKQHVCFAHTLASTVAWRQAKDHWAHSLARAYREKGIRGSSSDTGNRWTFGARRHEMRCCLRRAPNKTLDDFIYIIADESVPGRKKAEEFGQEWISAECGSQTPNAFSYFSGGRGWRVRVGRRACWERCTRRMHCGKNQYYAFGCNGLLH